MRLGVGDSEEVLPVYVAEMKDPFLLGLDYLIKVGACVDWQSEVEDTWNRGALVIRS